MIFISEWQNQEFNLEKDPLLKIALINEFNLDKNILLFNAHHIIMDGWSLQLFAQEFIEIFNTLTETNEINPEVPEIQFKDYSEWLVPKLNEKELKDFWKSRLSDFNFESLFMAPLSRNENHSKNGEFLMPLNINVSSIREICNENSVTLHSFLTASLNVVIHKIFGINDFCLGTINSGRELPVLQNQLGMFVKTLPLKTRIDETLNLFDFAKNVQEELLLVNAHQNLPLEWIGKQFFEMILIYQNQDQMINIDEELSGYKLRSYPMERKYSKPHLIFNFQEYSNEFKILIEYVPALYEKEAIELIILRLEKLWNTVLENSKGNINSINLDLDFEVKNTLDFDFNF